jgi:hypothetical protein
MDIYRTARASASAKAEPFLDRLDPVVAAFVDAISPDALAVWDIRQHDNGPCSLHLCLCDGWRHVHCEFRRDEMPPDSNLQPLVTRKLATFTDAHRRILFKLRDATCAHDDLTNLRQALNMIPDIAHRGLKVENRCEFVPCNAYVPATAFRVTDFTLEVDAVAAADVADALRSNGFEIEYRTHL